MTPKPQEIQNDSNEGKISLFINGYLVAILHPNNEVEFMLENNKNNEYWESLLIDERKSHDYHEKRMSTNYN